MKENNIAVIATVLNEKDNIKRLITDFLNQSIDRFKIVIVDGGSRDGTWEELNLLAVNVPNMKIIRDDSCSLQKCPGPIGRGRNRAIEMAEAEIIACADAGCHYDHQWLERLVEPIVSQGADFAIGGSCFEKERQSAWDVAAAPFLGVDLQGRAMPQTPTGTARSLAFTKEIWRGIGKFSEKTLCGEDTEYLFRLRKWGRGVYVPEARAIYLEHFNFKEAITRIIRYAHADGLNKICFARFIRMLFRCVFGIGSIILLQNYPFLFVLFVITEVIFAVKHDYRGMVKKEYLPYLPIRIAFSFLVPYIFSFGYIKGLWGGNKVNNRQNTSYV